MECSTDAGEDPEIPGLLLDVREHVATVILNRPSRLNSLTPAMLASLRLVLESLSADGDIRAVVLTGAGRAFSAGGDIAEMRGLEMSSASVRDIVSVAEVLCSLRPVTIAAINGPCAGGGMALACAADLRAAASSAFLVTSFLAIGTTGDMGLPWHLSRLVGIGKAKELSLLGERIDADEALHIGLVNWVVPDDRLLDVVAEKARRLASFAPLACAGLKKNLNDATRTSFAEFLDLESVRYAANAVTADSAEAVRAFHERRPATYHGR